MSNAPSDALVLFGVTGDLAHKMIFPALYVMAKRGDLKVPVVGVAAPELEPGGPARSRQGQHQAMRAATTTSARSTSFSRCSVT